MIEGWHGEVAAFDTESTGPNPLVDRIVTCAVVHINADGEVTRTHEWIIDPGVPILETATEVHGITDEIAQRDGSDPAQSVEEIVRVLTTYTRREVPIAAYNAPFDFSILRAEAERHGIDWTLNATVIDPFVLDKGIDMYRKGSRKLMDVAEHYGITLDNAHNATTDALAVGLLAQEIVPLVLDDVPEEITSLRELHFMQSDWKLQQALGYQSYRRREEPDFQASTGWPLLDRPLVGADTEAAILTLIEDLRGGCKRDHAIDALEKMLEQSGKM